MRSHIGAIATVTAALLVMSLPVKAADDWVTKQSSRSVADTVSALTAAVDKAGAKVMATVDHQANAATIDTEIPATTLVIFGNPKLGTPLIAENRRVAIDLPQKVLIWEEDGVTMLGYVDPAELAERYGFAPDHPSIEAMQGALGKLTDAASADQ